MKYWPAIPIVGLIFIALMAPALAKWLAAIFAMLLFLLCIAGIWWIVEKMKVIRALRLEAERKAEVLVVNNGSQTWAYHTREGQWHNLALGPRLYANGQMTRPEDFEMTNWRLLNAKSSRVNKPLIELPEERPLELLPLLDKADTILLVGARGSGKTTLLKQIIKCRQSWSKITIVDPHSTPTTWPDGYKIIGAGRDYDAISTYLGRLVALMNDRFKELASGKVKTGEHERVTLVVDEWRAIVMGTGEIVKGNLKTLLAESRKANIDIILTSHSSRVKPLGIEGEGDLKDGFTMVRLSVNKQTNEHKATVNWGEGDVTVILPGKPDRAIELYQQGHSITAIGQEVYGSKGGNQNMLVKRRLGLDYP